MVEEFRARRDLIVDGLNAIPGINCLRPSGAFYVFPDISGTGLTGAELADRLLEEAGVSALAGTAFGRVGTHHLRFSYANSRENIPEAIKRTRAVVEPLAAGAVAAAMTIDEIAAGSDPDRLYRRLREEDFARYEVLKDLVDECIDLELNYRQSGHPGGSRSKVHMLLALLLSGAMRWDIRRPWLRFGDRFVLSAGHTVPLVYATLAVLNEGLRARAERTGDPRFAFPEDGRFALTWEHLLRLRHRGGLPGHAEMAGRTLFFKANTGPSGHGMPFAAGEALALKLAGADEVKVFVVEGEGGLTPGAAHETKNSAWGLGLSNLVFLVDWNDFGIDERPASSVVHGTPEDWFAPVRLARHRHARGHGLGPGHPRRARGEPRPQPGRASRASRGSGPARAAATASSTTPATAPRTSSTPRSSGRCARSSWPATASSTRAWTSRLRPIRPPCAAQAEANLRIAIGVLRRDEKLVDWLSDRLLEIAATVPDEIEGLRLDGTARDPSTDARHLRLRALPRRRCGASPATSQPNRAALGDLGLVRQRRREARLRPPAVHRLLGRPGRVDQHRRLRQAVRRHARLRLVRARRRTRPARSCPPRSPSSPTPA